MNTKRNRWLDVGSSESESAPPVNTPAARRPPCADNPDTWDLDTGSPDLWRVATQICHECPLRAECQTLAETLISRGEGPRAMIWAGIGYDNAGKIVLNLERYRGAPSESRRPLRIIRTGTEPTRSELTFAAPARRIVLGRQSPLRLPRTGTDDC